jgi:hypothetical protein
VGVVGSIAILLGVAALIFHGPLTGLLVRLYGRHSARYPLLYPGPPRRLVQDPSFVRWIVFSVATAWIAIGVIETAASFD